MEQVSKTSSMMTFVEAFEYEHVEKSFFDLKKGIKLKNIKCRMVDLFSLDFPFTKKMA